MNDNTAYVVAVIFTDGWIDKRHYIGLNAKDKDFVDTFAKALANVLRRKPILPRQYQYTYGPQWRASAGSVAFHKWFLSLAWPDVEYIAMSYPGPFLQGVYDSEGTLFVRKRGPSSVQPCYKIYNTDVELLEICFRVLNVHNIHSKLSIAGRIGDKTVGETVRKKTLYQLLWAGHTASRLWEALAPSSIERKRYAGPGPTSRNCPKIYLPPQ